MVEFLLEKYPLRRIVAIADHGLLSEENVTKLADTAAQKGRELKFILAVPARKYEELKKSNPDLRFDKEGCQEGELMGHRLIAVCNSKIAMDQTEMRIKQIKKLLEYVEELKTGLEVQSQNTYKSGRKLTLEEAKADFVNKARSKGLLKVLKLNIMKDSIEVEMDSEARFQAEKSDGKMAILTNVKDMSAEQIVEEYRQHEEIELSFREMKSEFPFEPLNHSLSHRNRAHSVFSFLALLLNRIMRSRLRKNGSTQSPAEAIRILNSIKRIETSIKGSKHTGLTEISQEQLDLFDKLEVTIPNSEENLE